MAICGRLSRVLIIGCCCLAVSACQASTWSVLQRDGAGRHVAPYVSSLGGGERGIGAVRSDTFDLDADIVSFEMCGADGWPGQRRFKSWFALCDADTGLALRRVAPPGNDQMTPVRWDVVEFIGRRVYFRAVDALAENAFAWIGWQNVRVGDRATMAPLTPGQLPAGWTEESQPEDSSVDEWLNCEPASSHWAMEQEASTPTWAVMSVNGVRADCEPYLSSLRGGEQGTGAVRSPEFTLASPTYTFLAMGADSPTGDAGLNLLQLVDAESQEILRQAQPPVGNTMVPIEWDTAELVGRRVFFRAVDGNAAPGWAWIGLDRIPLGEGRVAVFSDPEALIGWAEEGQPEGALIGGEQPADRTLEDMICKEWDSQDVRRGVRWRLWRRNPQAAPHLRERLCRIMQADFDRGKRLQRDFRRWGATRDDLRPAREELRRLRRRFDDLRERSLAINEWQDLRRQQRQALRRLALKNPLLSFDRILLVKRFTQQSYADINVNHHAWGSRPGGDIYVLSGLGSDQPELRPLLDGRLGPGNVHGIDLDYDARRIVFAYTRAASPEPPKGWLVRQNSFELHRTLDLLHIYEMRPDGSHLRQLTDGQWSDLNPCYLPDGNIAFESERCHISLQCNEYDKDEPTTNLYVMGPDGTGIRRLGVTKDGDWYPRVGHDGAIIYSHWEYHERGLMFPHPLWMMRPDGTGSDAFAKQHFNYPLALTVPRPVPNSRKIIAIATGHHTLAAGPVVLTDRAQGINNPACLTRITGPDVWPELGGVAPRPAVHGWRIPPGQGWYMDPYPLSETTFLAAYCDGGMQDETGYGLYLVDVYGGRELLYRDSAISCVMPIPLRPRPRPNLVPDVRPPGTEHAVCMLTNAAEGVPQLAAGAVKWLRIAEPVAWPYCNEIGGQRYEPDAKATGVNWTPVRIIGTVPVQADGSAHFEVPTDTALYFQALDAKGMELRRMRSYVSFQPGEVRGCNGCHETRAAAPSMGFGRPAAFAGAPSKPIPPPWGDSKPISFLRDVQPMLTRRCLSCHSGLKPAGSVDLSPGLTASYNRAYDNLLAPQAGLISVSSKNDDARITDVGAFGSRNSKLVAVLRQTHRGRCTLTSQEWRRLYTWIDANAVYHDDFIRKRPASAIPYSLAQDEELWAKIGQVHQRRCASCHDPATLARPEWVDLHRPQRSLFITAPLAGAKTPSGKTCPQAVYGSLSDPDCAQVLSLLREASHRAWDSPRRDLRCLAGDPDLRACLSFETKAQGAQ